MKLISSLMELLTRILRTLNSLHSNFFDRLFTSLVLIKRYFLYRSFPCNFKKMFTCNRSSVINANYY